MKWLVCWRRLLLAALAGICNSTLALNPVLSPLDNELTFSRGQWLREQSFLNKTLHIPLRRGLSLPSPEDPPRSGLVGIHLSLDEVSDVTLVRG